jgi:hypothetical protein
MTLRQGIAKALEERRQMMRLNRAEMKRADQEYKEWLEAENRRLGTDIIRLENQLLTL